ncbi:cell division protein ZapA [Psychrobacter sp. NG25]|uniref:cell division protein ZapA n=1 Tax=Psychrobacter sp. NG25 TaxID=2782005 RepID=UPI00188461F9|nr:cell division protein ZapA [Psychrobacter sp. NG25]MBF0659045.1 cell division protein ZapA [Psychrobacter sp. NG25]
MTDDHKKPIEKQLPNIQTQNTALQPKNVATAASIIPNTAAQPNMKVAEPQIKKVDIAIAGVNYPIYCPVHEQEELHSAVSYINNYALDLKRDAPSLSQENLLVLCCLSLYEKIHANQRTSEDRLQQDKQSEALLNKIMKDAQSIL